MIENLMILGSVKLNELSGAVGRKLIIRNKKGDFHPINVIVIGIIGLAIALVFYNVIYPIAKNAINTFGSDITDFVTSISGSIK